MVYKNIQGRLGNQMFQYAAAKAIMKKNNILGPINCCFKDVYKKNFKNELQEFHLKNYCEVPKIKLYFFQKLVFIFIKLYEFFLSKLYDDSNYEIKRNKFEKKYFNLFKIFGIIRITDGYQKIDNLNNKKNYIISGGLESPKYFDDIRNDLLEEFTPRHKRLKSNSKLYEIIEKTNSVCISIRRGDFLNSEFKNKHFICDIDYFKKAIKIMNKKIIDPIYIVFSDDIEWCKENLNFIPNAYFESGTDPVWEKLRLMYLCKNFIISNSTFSWWAQYLSRNSQKIVIAPAKWKNYGIYEDIYEDFFIKI